MKFGLTPLLLPRTAGARTGVRLNRSISPGLLSDPAYPSPAGFRRAAGKQAGSLQLEIPLLIYSLFRSEILKEMPQHWCYKAEYPSPDNQTTAGKLLRVCMEEANLVAASILYGGSEKFWRKTNNGAISKKVNSAETVLRSNLLVPPTAAMNITEVRRGLGAASYILGLGARIGEQWDSDSIDWINSRTPLAIRMIVRAGHCGLVPASAVIKLCQAASAMGIRGYHKIQVLNLVLDELGVEYAAIMAKDWAFEPGQHLNTARFILASHAIKIFKDFLETPQMSSKKQESKWGIELGKIAWDFTQPQWNRLTASCEQEPDHDTRDTVSTDTTRETLGDATYSDED